MHDLTKETLVPVQQIPDLPLFAGRKKRLHHVTIYNWINKGIRGVKLQAVRIGQEAYSSHESLARFIQATNPTPPSAPPPPKDHGGPSAPPPPPYMDIPMPRWPLPEKQGMERVKLLPEVEEERVVLLPEEEERVQLAPEVEDEVERVVLLPQPLEEPARTPRVIEDDPTLYPPEPRQRVGPPPTPEEMRAWCQPRKNRKKWEPPVVEFDVPEGGFIYVPPLPGEQPVPNRHVVEEDPTPPPPKRRPRMTNG